MNRAEEKNQRRNRIIDAAVFAVLLAAVSAVTLQLFYGQTQWDVDSDMDAYILEMQGLESGYSFPYPVFFKLAALVHLFAPPALSVAIATMLLNGLGMVVTKLAFNCLALPGLKAGLCSRRGYQNREEDSDRNGEKNPERNAGVGAVLLECLPRIAMSLLAVSLFFISMLYPPAGIYLPGIKFRYVGVFSANPFHNATYMAARPFAILAFLWFVKLLPVYEKGGERRDYILFSLFLLAATMTKPSFTLVLVSAAGLLMLYRLLRAGFRNFVPTVQLGLCFIPTFLDLLYQYRGVFVSEGGQERGLGFGFGEVWADYCDNIPLGICLAIGFPLAVLVLNNRACRKDTMLRFSWLLYGISFAEAFFLYEKGFRKVDFNFSWGYMYGIFFCHFGSLLLLVRSTAAEMAQTRGGRGMGPGPGGGSFWSCRKQGIALLVQWLAYLCHVLCGVLYFRDMLLGGTYY